jgi:tRNA(Arg) A34 adenosine deaminase TadA
VSLPDNIPEFDRGALVPRDFVLLRRAFTMAERAVTDGERPFGAVIADQDGEVLVEISGRGVALKDVTAHAETSAVRDLRGRFSRDFLASCTLYSSAEPCAMCAGAIYWSNIRRVVFGLSEQRLRGLRNVNAATSALTIGCADVLASGGYPITVIGSVLEDEAVKSHIGFWEKLGG